MTTTYRPTYPPHEGNGALTYYTASRLNEWAYRLHEADRDFGIPCMGTDAGSVRRYLDTTICPGPAQEPARTPVPESWREGQRVLIAVILAVIVIVLAYGQGGVR